MENTQENISRANFWIRASKDSTYASMLHEAITKLENEVYFPAIKRITPEYQTHGLWILVEYDPTI